MGNGRSRISRALLMGMLSCTRSLVESDENTNGEQAGRLHIFGICTMVEIGEESLDIKRPRYTEGILYVEK